MERLKLNFKGGWVMDNIIRIITNESGDWSILKNNGFKISGHSLDVCEFKELLEYLGYEVDIKEIPDKEMENMC